MKLRVFAIIAFVVLVSVALYVFNRPQKTLEDYISCTINESPWTKEDGWGRLESADFYRATALSAKGKVEVKPIPGTLLCTVFIDKRVYPDVKGGLIYWRSKKKT